LLLLISLHMNYVWRMDKDVENFVVKRKSKRWWKNEVYKNIWGWEIMP